MTVSNVPLLEAAHRKKIQIKIYIDDNNINAGVEWKGKEGKM